MSEQEYKKEEFRDLGFRCIEPAKMSLPDGSSAEVVAYGYQLHKEANRTKPTNKPAYRIYSVSLNGQKKKEFDEEELTKLYGEAFTKLK